MSKKIRFTKDGLEKLKGEYEELISKRPLFVEELRKARELGDLSENGYYKAAKSKLSSVDYRLRWLSFNIKNGVVVGKYASGGGVEIGSKVIVFDGKVNLSFEIVGDLEADPGRGKLSLLSPLGKAIFNKNVGDAIEIKTPKGLMRYSILSIE